MRTSKIIRDTRTVLNIDAFDRRRFQEIYELTEGLQQVKEELKVPAAESFLRDVWASFFKMKPSLLKGDASDGLDINRKLVRRLMADEQFERHRNHTKLDDLASTISALTIGEKLNRWLDDVRKFDAEIEQRLDTVRKHEEGLSMEQLEADMTEAADVNELNEAIEELDEALDMVFELNGERFANMVGEALENAVHTKKGLVSLMGGGSVGKGDADLKKIPLRDQLMLAEKLAFDPQLKKIAEWAGRFNRIAEEKQQTNYKEAIERRGVVRGNDLASLLPSEYGLYMHPVAKKEFLRRLAEGETMQYDRRKRDNEGKGPVVFCLDQSGSMSDLDSQAKGFIIALLTIAKKQSRDVCVVLFSTTVQRFTFRKGVLSVADLCKLVRTYVGGGTDFTLGLKAGLQVIEESPFSKADLLFVTDGEDDVDEEFLKDFCKAKKEKGFEVLSLVMGNKTTVPEKFSDKVLRVSDFNEEGSFTAFEI